VNYGIIRKGQRFEVFSLQIAELKSGIRTSQRFPVTDIQANRRCVISGEKHEDHIASPASASIAFRKVFHGF
jgi:hypothetical protein